MIAQVIHDSRRVDRAEMLLEQSRLNAFEYDLWPAKFFDGPTKHILGPWEAHKQIIRWAKERKMPCVWICEDDVKFTHPKAIDYYLANIPQDGETNLYLGGVWQSRYGAGELRSWSGTHCYMVFARFYDRMLAAPTNNPIDVWLSQWHAAYGGNRIKVCRPLVAKCYDSLSGTRGDYLPHDKLVGEDCEFYAG